MATPFTVSQAPGFPGPGPSHEVNQRLTSGQTNHLLSPVDLPLVKTLFP